MNILVLNTGSSSIKFAVFENGMAFNASIRGSISHIGQMQAGFKVKRGTKAEEKKDVKAANHQNTLQLIITWLKEEGIEINAIGHRLVHGGKEHHLPVVITTQLVEELKQYIPFAPEHLPNALAAIEDMREHYPGLPQVACFDTAFHWQMPQIAQTLPLPIHITKHGIRKYGFHGLSYEYIYGELQKHYSDIQQKKIVIAHLGSGASMVAIKYGKSIDTTMGFTPAGGLIMSSRTGDIDPGVLIYLLEHYKYSTTQLNELLNNQSGLKGISGISGDMQVLEEYANDTNAQLATNMFCYQAKKHLGALIAALGGIDVLVFTGGIGQASSATRTAICTDMQYAGIVIDEALNQKNKHTISSADSKAVVHVMPTDEEYMIAQHVIKLI